jgi:hypothetical protein
VGSPHRSKAWRSVAETDAHLVAESSTRLKQAATEADETEAAIQASLAAALDDLERLEQVPPATPARNQPPRVLPKVPRGMPPLPHGKVIPPLPVSRTSLLPRLMQSLRPKPSAATATQPYASETALQRPASAPAQRARPRWPAVVAALVALTLLGAGLWWMRLR